jgi:general secretion pathway protein B
MSYILEALKKSELARQEGVAALHYSLLPVVMEEDMIASRRWPYYALAAGVVLNAAAFYLWPSWSAYSAAQKDATIPSPMTQVAPAPAIAKADIAVPPATVQVPAITTLQQRLP